MNNTLKGYLLGAVAAATYGMNPLFALPLYADGLDPDSVLFFRYLFAIPILALMLRLRGRGFRIKGSNIIPLAALGLLFSMSSLTLFESYNYMDAGIASTILFVYPIMVALIMATCFHERLTLRTIVCLAVALCGIGLLYKGSDGATLSLVGTAIVMLSALSYAVYIVAVNRSRLRTMATLKVTFYVTLFGWLLFLVRTLAAGGPHMPSHHAPYLWLNLFALGLLPTAVSLLCTTAAIQYIGSTPTAILGALEPATAVFFGVVVFGEVLTPREMLGFVLIIGAVSVVVTAGAGVPSVLTRFRHLFPKIRRNRRRIRKV